MGFYSQNENKNFKHFMSTILNVVKIPKTLYTTLR